MMAIAISLAIGLLVGAAFCVAWFVIDRAGERKLGRRARKLGATARRDDGKRALVPRLRRESLGLIDGLARRFVPGSAALVLRLAASGTGWSMNRYRLVCLTLWITATILLLLCGLGLIAATVTGLAVALALPHLAIGLLIQGRRAKFIKLFPEAIGLMVRGLKAGLAVTETLSVVGGEVGDPVGEEFRSVADQIKLGQRVEDALWAVARRLKLPEFNFLVIALSVQRETGGNLAETLENLDEILRKRQQMRLKVKAMSSEAVASAGIIGSLPFIMIALLFVVSRSYIMTLFTTDTGLFLTAIGAVSLSVGVFVMMRMVRFDI